MTELKIFRNKVPLEIKITWYTYIQTSVRRTARICQNSHSVSKTAVWNWIKKFEERLPITTEKKKKRIYNTVSFDLKA